MNCEACGMDFQGYKAKNDLGEGKAHTKARDNEAMSHCAWEHQGA